MKKAIIIGKTDVIFEIERVWKNLGFEIVDRREDNVIYNVIEDIWKNDVATSTLEYDNEYYYFYSVHGKLRITSGMNWVVIWTVEEEEK